MTRFAMPAAIALAAFVASPVTAQEASGDLQTTVTQLHEQFETAYNAANAAEVAGLYAEDAVILPPMADRTEGRAAIEELFATEFQERSPTDLAIENVEVRQVGDAVIDIGTYQLTAEGPGGEPMPVQGDYLALLESAEDGQWRVVRHIWNQDFDPDLLMGAQ